MISNDAGTTTSPGNPLDIFAGDGEMAALARALTLLLEERVFLSGDRAVVFE
jgi:formyltetrahydrofolate hydrolase